MSSPWQTWCVGVLGPSYPVSVLEAGSLRSMGQWVWFLQKDVRRMCHRLLPPPGACLDLWHFLTYRSFIPPRLFFRATLMAYGSSQARGVQLELQLPAYTTATATLGPRGICNLHCSLQQCWLLNPLSEAGDGTRILTETRSGP